MTNTKNYWNDRYASGGNSGYGSYGDQAELKLSIMRKYITNVKSITDIGCGDFAFSKRICEQMPGVKYKGFDVSDVVIEENKKNNPGYSFDVEQKEYPKADLVLCIDVLFHFGTKEEMDELLNKLEQSWSKYLVLTADDRINDVSRFGKPLIKELIEGKDAFLYIWKK